LLTTNSKQTPEEAYFEPPVTTLGTDTVNFWDCFLGLLHLKQEKWPTPLQPRAFHSQVRTWPCCLHPLGAPTHLHLSKDIAMPDSYDVMKSQETYMHPW